jgi:hypothetical protein
MVTVKRVNATVTSKGTNAQGQKIDNMQAYEKV